MIAYQTDQNGVYVGTVICDESPLEPGVFLVPAGCVEVAPPDVGTDQYAVWNNDAWEVLDKPVVEPEPPVVVTWSEVREFRNALLRESDWSMLTDAPLTDEQRDEWVVYRQALRDVPQTQDDPNNVVWPESP